MVTPVVPVLASRARLRRLALGSPGAEGRGRWKCHGGVNAARSGF